jgi:hypothetical protein
MRCHQLNLNFMLTGVAANSSDEPSGRGIARVACCASSSSDE